MGEKKRRILAGTMLSTVPAPPNPPSDEIFPGALDNLERLHSCTKHYFLPRTSYAIGDLLECVNCKGKMSLTMLGTYIDGFVAAGGDPVEISPDWE